MIIVFGEILCDIFENYERPGGAPFNFAYNLKKMGQNVRFITRVGSDRRGDELIDFAGSRGFSKEDIQVDHEHPTGVVKVNLDEKGVPAFNIVPDAAYDYTAAEGMGVQDEISLIYFGTLIQRTQEGHSQLQSLLKLAGHRCIKFCDINLRPGCYSRDTVLSSLKNCNVLKMNSDELEIINEVAGLSSEKEESVVSMSEIFGIDTIAVTAGPGTSMLYRGKSFCTMNPEEPEFIADTVGAGDAFASVLALGLLRGWETPLILERALALSSLVCMTEGALLGEKDITENTVRKGWQI